MARSLVVMTKGPLTYFSKQIVQFQSTRLFSAINNNFQRFSYDVELFLHCCLDIVDDKLPTTNEMFLGQLYSDQKFKVYLLFCLFIEFFSVLWLRDKHRRSNDLGRRNKPADPQRPGSPCIFQETPLRLLFSHLESILCYRDRAQVEVWLFLWENFIVKLQVFARIIIPALRRNCIIWTTRKFNVCLIPVIKI